MVVADGRDGFEYQHVQSVSDGDGDRVVGKAELFLLPSNYYMYIYI
jgi:hypothetical protein